MSAMIEPMLLTLIGAAMITAAAYDATTLTIPNWISLALVALFPILAVVAGLSWSDAGIHAAIGFGALLIGMGLFAMRVIGGGDAKMFAAVALYMGASSVGAYVFMVALAGGAIACLILLARGLALSPLAARLSWLRGLASIGNGLPYGIAIAAGGLVVFPATHLFALATSAQ
jgi:prepilin peptidase CpaA